VSRGRAFLAAAAFYMVLDVGAARLLDSTPLWGSEAVERRYRIPHPVYHHDLAPDVRVAGHWGALEYSVITNSLGFRSSVTGPVSLRSSRRRLLLLGDSFTEGVGVPFEETYAGLLQRALAPRGIEVLNAAVMSYAPSIYWRKTKYLLEDVGLRFDYVLVALDLSDIGDEAHGYRVDSGGRVVGRAPGLAGSLRQRLKNGSLFFHVADLVWDGAKGRLADPFGYADWTTDASQYEAYGREGLALAEARMNELSALLHQRGIGLGIAVYPYPAEVVARQPDSRQVRFWRAWGAAHGADFFDLFPAFQAAGSSPDAARGYFIPHDVHWNARGHGLVKTALLAEGLADSVAGSRGVRP